MIRRIVVVAALVAVAPAWSDEVEPPVNPSTEMRRTAGEWRVVAFERDGQKVPKEQLKKWKVVLGKGGDADFRVEGNVVRSRATLHPNKKPRQVDSTYLDGPLEGKTIKGIYKLQGDRMTCCFADPGGARPTEFATKADSRLTLYVLERVKGK